jgi:3-oxoacyl-[acyl-carrier-protein] synthase-3
VETNDEWIVARTGIRERHIAAEGEFASDLALHACRKALEAAGRTARGCRPHHRRHSTPDMVFPSTACILQAKLGCPRGAASTCRRSAPASSTRCHRRLSTSAPGRHRCALVVGRRRCSPRILDWKDRGTCVLFGDGAGAVVLELSRPGILSSHLHADGKHAGILNTPGQRLRRRIQGDPTLKMDGGAVFKLAVRVLEESAREAVAANGMQLADIDAYIPHQANVRIISHVGKKLGLAEDKCIVTVDRHANTSAARFRSRSMSRFAMGASRRATRCCCKAWAAGSPGARSCSTTDMTTAIVFPGPGSQSVGMMKGFADVPVVKRHLRQGARDRRHRLLADGRGRPAGAPQPDRQYAAADARGRHRMLVRVARARRGDAAWFAGHSLGEYTALVAAEALTFEDALPLVRFRAQSMQEAVPEGTGGIAAILGSRTRSCRSARPRPRRARWSRPRTSIRPGRW